MIQVITIKLLLHTQSVNTDGGKYIGNYLTFAIRCCHICYFNVHTRVSYLLGSAKGNRYPIENLHFVLSSGCIIDTGKGSSSKCEHQSSRCDSTL